MESYVRWTGVRLETGINFLYLYPVWVQSHISYFLMVPGLIPQCIHPEHTGSGPTHVLPPHWTPGSSSDGTPGSISEHPLRLDHLKGNTCLYLEALIILLTASLQSSLHLQEPNQHFTRFQLRPMYHLMSFNHILFVFMLTHNPVGKESSIETNHRYSGKSMKLGVLALPSTRYVSLGKLLL